VVSQSPLNDAKRGELIKKATWMIHEMLPVFQSAMLSSSTQQENTILKPTQKHAMELVLIKDVDIK
jgi:hypothetical protein